jgi:[protein-PII] uridylyltransferase
MDVLLSGVKMKVGYAYRTFADIEGGTLDHQTQSALLDARPIAGDLTLFARFDRLFHEHLQMADFLFHKEAERHLRREKPGASIYATEPDVKNGVGGLRDLQTAGWMGRVRFKRPGEALWRDMVHRRALTREDLRRLQDARETLLTVRCALHLAAGEQRDSLTRYRQEQVAAHLGLKNSYGDPDIETLMRRYYTAVADIDRISGKVVSRCLDTPIPLGRDTGLSAARRRVAITNPALAAADSLWPIRALDYAQTYTLRLEPATEEAMQEFAAGDNWSDDESKAMAGLGFLQILLRPGDTVGTLRRLHRNGLLEKILPEFAFTMNLAPYDPSHIYTIGEHSLYVLGNIIALRDGIADEESRRASHQSILRALDSPLPLYLAALLHDIGKQWSQDKAGNRQPHEITGAEQVTEICRRLGCAPETTANVEFLVRHHLLLAQTSRLRDLGQPATIREVARIVGDVERLRMLYLLTYADTKAVGPGILTDMNARLLHELFARTEGYLLYGEGDDAADAESERLNTVRARLQRQLGREPAVNEAAAPEDIRTHIEAMPASYLLNTPLEKMAQHLNMVARLRAGETEVIEMHTMPDSSTTEITVVTHDDPEPGLLAKLTGALLVCDVDLYSIQVFTRPAFFEDGDPHPIAIDTLWTTFHDRPLSREKRLSVEESIRIVLRGEATIPELLEKRRKPFSPRQPVTHLHVDDTVSTEYTLLEVDAPDTLGLVYRFAALIGGIGWNILAARCTVWGGHVRCAFYITDSEGEALPAEIVVARLNASFVE